MVVVWAAYLAVCHVGEITYALIKSSGDDVVVGFAGQCKDGGQAESECGLVHCEGITKSYSWMQ
jgi:hypothetical protein